jgi:hypothetical protein
MQDELAALVEEMLEQMTQQETVPSGQIPTELRMSFMLPGSH